jgi:hypothetical protein
LNPDPYRVNAVPDHLAIETRFIEVKGRAACVIVGEVV